MMFYSKNINELNWDKVILPGDWTTLVNKSKGIKHIFENKELLIDDEGNLLAVYDPESDKLKTRGEICFKSDFNLFNTEASLL